MRVACFLALLIFLVSALLVCWSVELSESSWERLVPHDVLALAVVDDPESNLELLHQASVERLEGLVGNELGDSREQILGAVEGLFTIPLRRVCLLIHELEHREESTYKIHLSLILEPLNSGPGRIRSQIDQIAARLFESADFTAAASGQALVYLGSNPRQILYYRRLGRYHMVSNSLSGWEKLSLCWDSRLPRLSDQQDFITARLNLPTDAGILVYCDLSRILSLLPKFGYWIGRENGRVSEKFHMIE